MYIWSWLTSKHVRQASDLIGQARKILNAQRDLLSPKALETVEAAIAALQAGITSRAKSAELTKLMDALEEAAGKWLKPYRYPTIRENVEMLLTTVAVLFAVFTFFFQHFAIPSGSMQPTLYGIHHENHTGDPNFKIPGVFGRLYDRWVKGTTYIHIVAPSDGVIQAVEPPRRLMPFVKRQRILFNDRWTTIEFAPPDLAVRAGWVSPMQSFPDDGGPIRLNIPVKQGQDIIKLAVTAGDHLFVNRLTYNFRRPKRGEIVIFASTGLPWPVIQNTYYIKRLIATGGEKVRIGDDRHVIINGVRLDASTPHFENVYSFAPSDPPAESKYSGHVNGITGTKYGNSNLAPLFPDSKAEVTVGQGRFCTFGDNTMNSSDCRFWGYDSEAKAFGFQQDKVIGRASFVFWPITSRFGWGNR